MLISGRDARRRLCEVGTTDREARFVLASGLAGVPVITGAPVLSRADLLSTCPHGWFVSRRSDTANPSRGRCVEALQEGWHEVPLWTWLWLHMSLEVHGPLPFIASVSGFVYLGAEVLECAPGGRLVLGEPGSWFERFQGARLPLGRGRPWQVELAPRGVPRPAQPQFFASVRQNG